MASETLFKQRVADFYGSPETMAAGGQEHYRHADFGTALFFFAKSIDMLHTAYGFSQMQARRPSPADAVMVDQFGFSLGAALSLHPGAPVDGCVREVAHRLRSISTECERAGLPPNLYHCGLETIARNAPQVPTDDVLWT